jgi:hypothetical protein
MQVNILFVIDEISDDQNGHDARLTGETFLKAMHDPEWDDHSILSQITKEYVVAPLHYNNVSDIVSFRARFVPHAGPRSLRRFLDHCRRYVDALAREAELREGGEVLGLVSYTNLRRENSAVCLCFGLIEYVLGIDLPDEVFEDPDFMSLYWQACDCVCWANVRFFFVRSIRSCQCFTSPGRLLV